MHFSSIPGLIFWPVRPGISAKGWPAGAAAGGRVGFGGDAGGGMLAEPDVAPRLARCWPASPCGRAGVFGGGCAVSGGGGAPAGEEHRADGAPRGGGS